ncbi:hypothetical protein BN1221_01593 [Brenneria goodwinii]|uniref:Uncharacterized protein n=1 Tax=Brenneria goodwinii TaxID=1109412 RepID=A0A0G4JTB1_9GAMM|nr:hypothetical protein BN1221_01593 [Brenneria goodwinii]
MISINKITVAYRFRQVRNSGFCILFFIIFIRFFIFQALFIRK